MAAASSFYWFQLSHCSDVRFVHFLEHCNGSLMEVYETQRSSDPGCTWFLVCTWRILGVPHRSCSAAQRVLFVQLLSCSASLCFAAQMVHNFVLSCYAWFDASGP